MFKKDYSSQLIHCAIQKQTCEIKIPFTVLAIHTITRKLFKGYLKTPAEMPTKSKTGLGITDNINKIGLPHLSIHICTLL